MSDGASKYLPSATNVATISIMVNMVFLGLSKSLVNLRNDPVGYARDFIVMPLKIAATLIAVDSSARAISYLAVTGPAVIAAQAIGDAAQAMVNAAGDLAWWYYQYVTTPLLLVLIQWLVNRLQVAALFIGLSNCLIDLQNDPVGFAWDLIVWSLKISATMVAVDSAARAIGPLVVPFTAAAVIAAVNAAHAAQAMVNAARAIDDGARAMVNAAGDLTWWYNQCVPSPLLLVLIQWLVSRLQVTAITIRSAARATATRLRKTNRLRRQQQAAALIQGAKRRRQANKLTALQDLQVAIAAAEVQALLLRNSAGET